MTAHDLKAFWDLCWILTAVVGMIIAVDLGYDRALRGEKDPE